MFKIGEFSRIAQVSGRTLRHYDTIGLLKPVHIDPDTGYRFYSAEQLPRLNRILALKDLGLSLEQIGRLLRDELSPSEIRGMLTMRKAEIEQTVRAEIDRLRHVEYRLAQIEQEGALWAHDVILKRVPPRTILSIRETGAGNHFQELFLELQKALPAGRSPYEQVVFIMHSEVYEEEEMDIELGYLLADAVHEPFALAPHRLLTVRQLPAVELMATLVDTNLDGGASGYNILGSWLEANGYEIIGPGYEVFHEISWPNEGRNVMEIQFPVTRVEVA
ncbi:MAG: MerR family transcriptional regulator [Anaerolineales bacterium]|nr:MerR family transcriptional regulator [Anaerolineales bacterium]